MLNKVSEALIRRSLRWQKESGLRDLSLWGLTVNGTGRLSVGGIDAVALAEEHGTPLLVVNRERLVKDALVVKEAFSAAPDGSMILYSYKTNCIPGILRVIHSLGIGAEVISPYELWLAKRLGVPGDRIVYNGVNKTDDSIEMAIGLGVHSINIDSLEEIPRIAMASERANTRVNVGIRLGLVPGSQFGLDVDSGEAMAACRLIASMKGRLQFNCLHFNVTSNSKGAHTHGYYARRAIEFMRALRDELGIEIAYLDIGGGFGVETTKNMTGREYGLYRLLGLLPAPPSPSETQPAAALLGEVIDIVRKKAESEGLAVPKLIIEPGRLITSKCEFLLTRVNAVKEKKDGRKYAITDSGRLSTTFPCDFEYHEAFLANRPGAELSERYHVMGRICTSADWLFKNRLLPPLNPGDVLAVMDAGAYFSSYSTNFAFPRPAIVMVDEGETQIIQKAETFEHLCAMDAGPSGAISRK